MPADAGLPRENAPIADSRRSRDSNLRHDQTKSTDFHVMSDLNEVVDLGSVTDDGVVDASAIDRRVRADLDVVSNNAAADVRNLRVFIAARHVAKSVRAKDAA